MPKFEIIHSNSLDCELGRYEVPHDDLGYPLTLAAVAQNYDLRSALEFLEPGDVLRFVQNDQPDSRQAQPLPPA